MNLLNWKKLMDDLTIVTVVENDCGIVDLMIKSVRKFTVSPKILICDNGQNSKVLKKYKTDEDIIIISNTPTMKGGSNRHGEGLNKVISKVKTSRLAIVESDCVLVSNNWNKIGNHVAALSKKATHKDKLLYYAAFMILDTKLAKTIDFRPGNDKNRSYRSYKPHEDVAWRVGHNIFDRIKSIDCIDCKSGNGQILDKTFQSEEYVIDNETVAIHFGRGSNLAAKSKRKGFDNHKNQLLKFKDIVEKILEK